jgi:hypothetical protein
LQLPAIPVEATPERQRTVGARPGRIVDADLSS